MTIKSYSDFKVGETILFYTGTYIILSKVYIAGIAVYKLREL